MGGSTGYIQVSTTIDSKEGADKIAKHVVENKLAACAQVVGPIESTYRWKGKIESTQEWLVLMKTTSEDYEKLESGIRSIHHYKTPEIIAVALVQGNPDYLDWLQEALGRSNGIKS